MTEETIRVLAERDAVSILAIVIFAGMIVFLLGVRVYSYTTKRQQEQTDRVIALAETLNQKIYASTLETQKGVAGARKDIRDAMREIYAQLEDLRVQLKNNGVRDERILRGLTRIEALVQAITAPGSKSDKG